MHRKAVELEATAMVGIAIIVVVTIRPLIQREERALDEVEEVEVVVAVVEAAVATTMKATITAEVVVGGDVAETTTTTATTKIIGEETRIVTHQIIRRS